MDRALRERGAGRTAAGAPCGSLGGARFANSPRFATAARQSSASGFRSALDQDFTMIPSMFTLFIVTNPLAVRYWLVAISKHPKYK
jgi:hypothetical protein